MKNIEVTRADGTTVLVERVTDVTMEPAGRADPALFLYRDGELVYGFAAAQWESWRVAPPQEATA